MLFVERVRAAAIALFTPGGKALVSAKFEKDREVKRLEGENHLLRMEIGKLKALLEQQGTIDNYQKEAKGYTSAHLLKRASESSFLLDLNALLVPARVVYRDPAIWRSSIWVNVGEETNKELGRPVIGKNSPVVFGRGVVGALDYVGKRQSRVRLLTDLGLKPSVRAVRGFPQNIYLVEHIDVVMRALSMRPELSASRAELQKKLGELKNQLSQNAEGWYLAKGVLHGSGTPLWRRAGNILKGVGFNYDFADDEGSPRDLRTGEPVDPLSPLPKMPLIKVHDLLVTTGMDGIFPAGLCVAEVTKVFPLREGGYTYDLEAVPAVGNIDELQVVFIMPPVGYRSEDESCQS